MSVLDHCVAGSELEAQNTIRMSEIDAILGRGVTIVIYILNCIWNYSCVKFVTVLVIRNYSCIWSFD